MKKKQKRTLPLEVANFFGGNKADEVRRILSQAEDTPINERTLITPLHPEGIPSSVRQFAEAIFFCEKFDPAKAHNYEAYSGIKYIFSVENWSRYKEIFTFSREMVEILSEGSDGRMEIPTSVLELLPFPCFYVEMEGQEENGFFVDVFDGVLGNKFLRIVFLKEDGEEIGYRYFEFDLSSDDQTIQESLDQQNKTTRDRLNSMGFDPNIIDDFPSETIALAFSLLVYICCVNAEIKESSETASLHPQGRTKEQIASSSFKSVRKWIAGEEITRRIKVFNKTQRSQKTANEGSGIGSSKRPHIRSAHFHHYWTGKKDGSEERKLIVKWLQPTFVNGDSSDITVKRTEITE